MNHYAELLSYSFKNEHLARPFYDYLKALKTYQDAERDLLRTVRKARAGLADYEIIGKFGKHLTKPDTEVYYNQLLVLLKGD